MPITLILIIIAIILTLLINQKRRRVGNGNYQSGRECRALQHKLLTLVNRDVAERLIRLAKRQHPGKSERWYLEKVIYDLQRGR